MTPKAFWLALTVALLTFLLYASVLNSSFVWDDYVVVVNNSQIHRLFSLTRFFSGEGPIKQRPVMSLSLALDYRLWGPGPMGFHLTNLALHILSCLGVFVLGLRLLRSHAIAFASALLFAVHPLHTEAVAALLGRSDLLSASAILWGFLCYLEFRRRTECVALGFLLLALVLYALACLSKETGIVLVGWIALVEFLGLGVRPIPALQRFLRVLPFGFLACLYLFFLHGVSSHTLAKSGWWGGTFWNNLLMSTQVFGEYLRLLVFPYRLSPWYVIPVPQAPWDFKVLLGVLAFLGMLLAFILAWLRKAFRLTFLLGWYLICFFPLSNLVPIPGSMMAERWLYAGSVAFCLGIGLGWERLVPRLSFRFRRFAGLLGVLILGLLASRTLAAVRVWRTDFTLFRVILQEHPRLPKAHLWLADSYNRADSLRQAEEHYRTAMALAPDDPEVHADLGILYDKQSRFEQAVREYQTALRLGGEHPYPRMNLGISYEHLGRYRDALVEYEKALSLGAEKSQAYFRIGNCYEQLGDSLWAKEAYSRALSADPAFLEAGKRLSLLPR